MKNIEELIKEAIMVKEKAHCPNSNYQVGAALETKSGKVYTGCNIENYGIQSICAERVAFAKAISEGETEFIRIVVVGGPKEEKMVLTTPCGYCRQFMSEFVQKDFEVILFWDNLQNIKKYSIGELLPHSFELK